MKEVKVNAFEELAMDEMMAVDGGARSRSARSAASSAARANLTWSNVKQTTGYMLGYGVAAATGCTTFGMTCLSAAVIYTGWTWTN